jgi:hypothetical protein
VNFCSSPTLEPNRGDKTLLNKLFGENMPRLKLSPQFRNLSNFRVYKLIFAISPGDKGGGNAGVGDRTPTTVDCPICGRTGSSSKDTYTRRIRDFDLGTRQRFLRLAEHALAGDLPLSSLHGWSPCSGGKRIKGV